MANSKIGLAGIALLVLGVILFFGVLNYFNLISLSLLYPKYFGFLPHTPTNQFLNQSPSQLAIKPNLIPTCPVPKELCKSGIPIYNGNKFLGIGYKLPLGKDILASIPGPAVFGGTEDKNAGILSHAKITIGGSGSWQGYTATYEYFGLPVKKNVQATNVSQGEELGAVWGGNFPNTSPYNGINVLVLVQSNGQNILEFK